MQANIIGPFSPDPEAESTLDQQYIGAIGQVRAAGAAAFARCIVVLSTRLAEPASAFTGWLAIAAPLQRVP